MGNVSSTDFGVKSTTDAVLFLWDLCRKGLLWQILCILSSSVAVAMTSHFVILAPPNFPAITDALNKGCERAER